MLKLKHTVLCREARDAWERAVVAVESLTTSDDTISRRGAIDAVHKIGVGKTSTIKAITAALESLPAEPCTRKAGTWLDVEPAPFGQRYETCSECGVRQAVDKGKDNFCGVCGARMR